jgi:hypothetical protein
MTTTTPSNRPQRSCVAARKASESAAALIRLAAAAAQPPRRRHKNDFWPITNACKRSHPGRGCASFTANHKYTAYHEDPRSQFIKKCKYCKAFLLESEIPTDECPTKCCTNGKLHTTVMQRDWQELQNPPNELRHLSDKTWDEARRFVENAKAINSFCAFAAIKTNADPDAKGFCKINGEIGVLFGDLFPQEGSGI